MSLESLKSEEWPKAVGYVDANREAINTRALELSWMKKYGCDEVEIATHALMDNLLMAIQKDPGRKEKSFLKRFLHANMDSDVFRSMARKSF